MHLTTGRTAPALLLGIAAALLVTSGCGKGSGNSGTYVYQRTNLTASTSYVDSAGAAKNVDASLVSPLGITAGPSGALWIAADGTGDALVYNQNGATVAVPIAVPPLGNNKIATVTDIAYNGTAGFVISDTTNTTPAQYIFVTGDATISGWSPSVNFGNPIQVVGPSAATKSLFTGAATGSVGSANYLFVADFGAGNISIFDSSFQLSKTFTDTGLPSGYTPLAIRTFNNQLYVTFVKKDASGNIVTGSGTGYIDVFDTAGNLQHRLVSSGHLNAPQWMAIAPDNNQFGTYSGDLLVANYGDGTINAFDPNGGGFIGQLKDNGSSNPLVIPNLRGLQFGNGGQAGPTNELFFTASVTVGGLFGSIQVKKSN